jgi:hypothetical protein
MTTRILARFFVTFKYILPLNPSYFPSLPPQSPKEHTHAQPQLQELSGRVRIYGRDMRANALTPRIFCGGVPAAAMRLVTVAAQTMMEKKARLQGLNIAYLGQRFTPVYVHARTHARPQIPRNFGVLLLCSAVLSSSGSLASLSARCRQHRHTPNDIPYTTLHSHRRLCARPIGRRLPEQRHVRSDASGVPHGHAHHGGRA